MSFQPVIPMSGYAGWRFLQRTMDTQKMAFVESAPIKRAEDYFREKIGAVRTAEDLVSDRRLLEVALGAFGLDDDINNRFFIRKILEDGTLKPEALANKLADKRYAAFSRAFGFADLGGLTGISGFADKIIAKYEDRQFERAVGEQNDQMRLALNLQSGIKTVLEQANGETARWFSIMGDAPLRSVFQTALGFGTGFASIDLDQQLTGFRERSQAVFGTADPAEFADPSLQEKVIRLFMIRAEAANVASTSAGSIALSLLRFGQ